MLLLPSLPSLIMGKSTESLPIINATIRVDRKFYRHSWRMAVALLVVAFWMTMSAIRLRGSIPVHPNLAMSMANTCEQPYPAAIPSNLSLFTDGPGFAQAAANRLAGAVRIPTMCVRNLLLHRRRASERD